MPGKRISSALTLRSLQLRFMVGFLWGAGRGEEGVVVSKAHSLVDSSARAHENNILILGVYIVICPWEL